MMVLRLAILRRLREIDTYVLLMIISCFEYNTSKSRLALDLEIIQAVRQSRTDINSVNFVRKLG